MINKIIEALRSLLEKPIEEPMKKETFVPTHLKTTMTIWNEQPYFKIEELVSKEVFQARGEKAIELFDERAIATLIELRKLFNSSMTVNNWSWRGQWSYRGYRPYKYYFDNLHEKYKDKLNTHEGCAEFIEKCKKISSYSQHTLGRAFDFDVKGLTAHEAREKIYEWKKEGKLKFLTGVETDINWVHIDCRICDRLDADGLFKFKP